MSVNGSCPLISDDSGRWLFIYIRSQWTIENRPSTMQWDIMWPYVIDCEAVRTGPRDNSNTGPRRWKNDSRPLSTSSSWGFTAQKLLINDLYVHGATGLNNWHQRDPIIILRTQETETSMKTYSQHDLYIENTILNDVSRQPLWWNSMCFGTRQADGVIYSSRGIGYPVNKILRPRGWKVDGEWFGHTSGHTHLAMD